MTSQPPDPRVHRAHIREGHKITVPAAVRRHLDVEAGDELEFISRDGHVEMVKIRTNGPDAVGPGR